jgi:hypothetical protein
MDKVHKPSNSERNTSSSEPLRFHQKGSYKLIFKLAHSAANRGVLNAILLNKKTKETLCTVQVALNSELLISI